MVVFFLLFSFVACAHPNQSGDHFQFPAPSSSELGSKLSLWATNYFLPEYSATSGDIPLRDMHAFDLGPHLKLKEWCYAALEGSVRIREATGETQTYNYAGVTTDNGVDCHSIFTFNVGNTKFTYARGPFGDGIDNYILNPFRTLATDPAVIAPGSVIYIPDAVGNAITLPTGEKVLHDGYFFAADKGGAIKNNHIDVFVGTEFTAPFFPWIKNSAKGTFDAYLINNSEIKSALLHSHLLSE